MTDSNGPVDPDRIPYIPAWSDTPAEPHSDTGGFARPGPFEPFGPFEQAAPFEPATAQPPEAEGRRAEERRAEGRGAPPDGHRKGRRRGRAPVVAAVTLVLAIGAAAGWFLLRPGDDDPAIKEGACLAELSDAAPKAVNCESEEARYVVVQRFRKTENTTLCVSVSGDRTAVRARVDGDPGILCVEPRT